MSASASSSLYLQDYQNSYEGYTGVYEEWCPLFDTPCDPCPAWDLGAFSLGKEDLSQSLIPLAQVIPDFPCSNEQQLLYCDWGYWENEDDSYFSSWCCWDDSTTSLADENMQGSGYGTPEDLLQEAHGENDPSHYKWGASPVSWDVVPWSGQDSWFGNGRGEDSAYHGWHDVVYPYNYSPDGMGFCGEIFGYWPCLAGALLQGERSD